MSDSLRHHDLQHARPPCPSSTPRVQNSDSRPSSQWCHPTISSSVVPFSSCAQYLSASESFPMSQLFIWGGQSTGVSASASFLPKKSQGWSPSERTGWISLQSKGLSRVFSNTTVQKHQFFSAQPSSQSLILLHCDQKRCLKWFQVFWITSLDYGPGCDLSWRRFHVHLIKMWNSLFWDEMSYRYQLGLTGPLHHLKFVFPC